jgi:hypothetical protein
MLNIVTDHFYFSFFPNSSVIGTGPRVPEGVHALGMGRRTHPGWLASRQTRARGGTLLEHGVGEQSE